MNMSPGTSALALTGVITPLLFTTLVVVQGFLNAGYSHMAMPRAWLGLIRRMLYAVWFTWIVLTALRLRTLVAGR